MRRQEATQDADGGAAVTASTTEAQYRAMPGLSGTGIKTILESPAQWKWEQDHPRVATSAMNLGTIAHALILNQPLSVVVTDYPDFKTKAAREWRDEQEALGLIVVKADVMETAEAMARAVREHPAASALLGEPGVSEAVAIGQHRQRPLKGRIDRLTTERVIDIKTDRDVSPLGIQKAMATYGYPGQLRHYAQLTDTADKPAIIIAVRNAAPHFVAVYEIDELTWDLAGRAVAKAWDIYADCLDTDTWPTGLHEGIEPIDLRPWAFDQLDELVDPDAYADVELKL